MPQHPRKRHLVALADGQLPAAVAIGLRLHLLTCQRCRIITDGIHAERDAVSRALASLGSCGSSSEGWARLVAVAGPQVSTGFTGLRAAALLLLALPALLLLAPGPDRAGDLQEAARELAARPGGLEGRPARDGTADVRFVDAIDALRRDDHAAVIRDDCCADHDAEGPPDDGLLALRLKEPAISVLVMYDDVDRSRSLSRGDLVRWVSLAPNAQATRHLPVRLASLVR